MNLREEKKKGMGKGKGERTLLPKCHLPFSLPPVICKPGHGYARAC